jgi:chemotaxis protein histidine kinase CheA
MNDLSKNQSAFDLSIAAVRKKFADRAYEQSQQLDALLDRLETQPDDQHALQSVLQIAHRIAGVADTLGFGRLGELARNAENLTRTAIEVNTRDAIGATIQVTDALIEELDQIGQDTPLDEVGG